MPYPQFFLGCLNVSVWASLLRMCGTKSGARGYKGEVMFVDVGRVIFPGGVLKWRGDIFLCEVHHFPRVRY